MVRGTTRFLARPVGRCTRMAAGIARRRREQIAEVGPSGVGNGKTSTWTQHLKMWKGTLEIADQCL